ncbi:hypothetical protein ARMSODRAFT_627346 [Armillaria solidipes]|uniref:Uncharacterized protein n=1 Tax=Armillaria solidipes TaxID=1076256 RepID=A0A2H3BQZ3_9AGAR|nr:hypothetical protein ARMSODRAFT_627346 [Armillaria solidipes]
MSLHASLLLHYWPYPSNHGPEERPLAAGSVFPDKPYRWSQMQCSDCVHPTTTAGMRPIVNNDVFAVSRSLFERLYSQHPRRLPFIVVPRIHVLQLSSQLSLNLQESTRLPGILFLRVRSDLCSCVNATIDTLNLPTLRSSRRCMMEHLARLSCLCTRPLVMTAVCFLRSYHRSPASNMPFVYY